MRKAAVLALFALFGVVTEMTAYAGVASAITREMLEVAVERAAKTSGKVLETPAARRGAEKALKGAAERHGADVLKVVEDGGLEMLEAMPKYGDELVKLARVASPEARRALAMNVPGLLPLARRVGVEAVELEAKVPGQAANVFKIFGDDGGKAIAATARTEDIPRLIKYGEAAKDDGTRRLMLEKYAVEGPKLFERIPPKLVLASGLTGAMLVGTYRATEPFSAAADAIRSNPESGERLMSAAMGWGAAVVVLLLVIVLWRFRLMPWHAKTSRKEAGAQRPASAKPTAESTSAFPK